MFFAMVFSFFAEHNDRVISRTDKYPIMAIYTCYSDLLNVLLFVHNDRELKLVEAISKYVQNVE